MPGERTEVVETMKPLPSSKESQRIHISPIALDWAGLRSHVYSFAAVGGSPFHDGIETPPPTS